MVTIWNSGTVHGVLKARILKWFAFDFSLSQIESRERLKAGGEGDNRGWDGWMASLTRWTWVCVNSRSWWWTGRPGVLQSTGLQRVGHDWATWAELNLPWTARSNQSIPSKGNQSWIFIRRTDAEAPILWPPDVKNWLTGKDPDAGKDWRQEEKGMTEDEMVGWHLQLAGHEFEQEWVMDRETWHGTVHGVTKTHEWVTELTEILMVRRN